VNGFLLYGKEKKKREVHRQSSLCTQLHMRKRNRKERKERRKDSRKKLEREREGERFSPTTS
jgi:hypothetical protein